ncbi:DUF418 domain-containing protein [Parabacteroides sp. 52]|uniref:DUF418 domain-containing protein n=1 Tax=unclassified Parabacteroides TaxID=2649774 RepID=UPI0013D2E854|nr:MULTISPECIES: DUF418 domain-containing protein [unclassified Parabacteroides]MDH6535441.1 uncharacterized protein [Parabacteroides sp. PM5-20]NDV56084.1 DUF418 domain-containing protein [Parabacteroides sp. 52]
METQKIISTPLQRITVLDALRGFALLGVILTHMWQHYGIFSFGMEPREPLFAAMDGHIQWLMRNVIMGKFINIFAFLFGLSFFIQMDRADRKGMDFRKRFLWRMVILFVIGMIGNLFYTGDILSIYAVFGVLMVFLYKAKNGVLLLIAFLLLIGTPRITTSVYNQMVQMEQTTTENAQNNETRRTRPDRNENTQKPSFLRSAKANLTSGLQGKLNYQFGVFSRGYITMALFILGLVVGRLRFFEQLQTHKRKNLILFAAFVVGVVVINLIVGLFPQETMNVRAMRPGSSLPPTLLATMGLNDIKAVCLSGALAMGFIILYQIKGVGKYLDAISPYGRMGLTNYEMQNIIGCMLFSMWAFGSFFGRLGTTELFLLGVGIYVLQVVFSRYWMRYFLYGPLEWFWRSATYLKVQPFRKTK